MEITSGVRAQDYIELNKKTTKKTHSNCFVNTARSTLTCRLSSPSWKTGDKLGFWRAKVVCIQGRSLCFCKVVASSPTAHTAYLHSLSRGVGGGRGGGGGGVRLHGHHRSQKEHHSKLITPFWHQHLSCLRLPKRTHFSSRLIADVSGGARVRRDITQRVFTTLLTFVTVRRIVRVRVCVFFFLLLPAEKTHHAPRQRGI